MTGSVHPSIQKLKKAWAQRVLPLCLCGFLGVAFIAPAYAQSNDINNRLKRIENEVETLNRAVYKGEKPPASASSSSGEADAILQNRINQIETDLRNLTGKVEEANYANRQLQEKVDAMEARMNLMQEQAAAAAAAPPQPTPMATDPMATQGPQGVPLNAEDSNVIPPTMPDGSPVVIPPSQPQADAPAALDPATDVTGNETGLAAADAAGLYEQGFGQIKAQDYAGAESTFTRFMKEYPKHALAPNALYWLGETYYVRKNYDKAARTFAEAYQKYPKGPKGADNLLKLGLSLAGKGEKENACIALGQLKKEYPKGPEPVLKRGEQEIATLGCS